MRNVEPESFRERKEKGNEGGAKVGKAEWGKVEEGTRRVRSYREVPTSIPC